MKVIEFITRQDEAGERLDALIARRVPQLTRSRIQQLMEQILREREAGFYGSEWYCQGCLLQLLVLLNRLSMGKTGEAGEHSPLVSRVVEYIHGHCQEELRLDTLAKRFHMSKYYFSHVFKQEIGESPYSYLTRARIAQAKRMLVYETTSVMEISQRCGFSTPNHFSDLFRQKTGMSPNEYRAHHTKTRT